MPGSLNATLVFLWSKNLRYSMNMGSPLLTRRPTRCFLIVSTLMGSSASAKSMRRNEISNHRLNNLSYLPNIGLYNISPMTNFAKIIWRRRGAELLGASVRVIRGSKLSLDILNLQDPSDIANQIVGILKRQSLRRIKIDSIQSMTKTS